MRKFEDLVMFWKKFKQAEVKQIPEKQLKLEIAKTFGCSHYTINGVIENLTDFGMFTLVLDNKEKKIKIYEVTDVDLK